MNARRLLFVIVSVLLTTPLPAHADAWWWGNPVEPTAGSWQTWVIGPAASYRVLPPPKINDTGADLRALKALILTNDAQTRQQIAYWVQSLTPAPERDRLWFGSLPVFQRGQSAP